MTDEVAAKRNVVVLTASRSIHPDHPEQALDRAFFGNYPETKSGGLAAHFVVHRDSSGQVTITPAAKKTANLRDGSLVVMVLGQFEPGFPNGRVFTDEEKSAVLELLNGLVEADELEKKAKVEGEFGLPSGDLKGLTTPVPSVEAPEPTVTPTPEEVEAAEAEAAAPEPDSEDDSDDDEEA